MAKTYILEPTEAAFESDHGELAAEINFDWTALDGFPSQGASADEVVAFLESVFSGSKFEMMYGEEQISLIYADVNSSVLFTVSGEDVEDSYPVAIAGAYDPATMAITVAFESGTSPVAGTYTVSIYTGEDDEGGDEGGIPGLPNKNITLNYENPTNNGIALITKAVLWDYIRDFDELTDEVKAEFNDILYNPGYAPMERLAKAIAFVKETTDPYTSGVVLTNDLERIAFAICPDMFPINNNAGPVGPVEPAPGGSMHS